MDKIEKKDDLLDRFTYARTEYSEWRAFASEVDTVWKGDFDTKRAREDQSIQIVRPSEPYGRLRKLEQMIAIRAKKRYEVVPRNPSSQEMRAVDKLERFLRAYFHALRRVCQYDHFRRAAHFALLRGRAPIRTVYVPNRKHPPYIRPQVLDPLGVYPIAGEDGVEWYAREQRMTKWQLANVLQGFPDEKKETMDSTAREYLKASKLSRSDVVTLIEYWDDEQLAWGVGTGGAGGGSLLYQAEHGYGCLPFREIRLGDTGIDDQRWASMPFLGPVVDDIKAKAILQSKMATAAETSFFADLFLRNEDGAMTKFDMYSAPGEWTDVAPGTDPLVVNKTVNAEVLRMIYDVLENNININTLSPVTFAQDIPDTSGFTVSQVLSVINDQIADVRDVLQVGWGLVGGDILKLHELFAPDEGWEYQMLYGESKRSRVESITASDIDQRYEVNVSIQPQLAQEKLQVATAFNQWYQIDPATGKERMDYDTALELSGAAELIDDYTAMKKRRDWNFVKQNDPQIQQLEIARIKAENQNEIDQMRREVKKLQRRAQRKQARQAARDVEKGLSEDVVIPAEVARNPPLLHQYAILVEQGQEPHAALQVVQSGMQLGMPGQQQASGQPSAPAEHPAMKSLLDGLFGADVQVGQEPQGPNGLTGYGNGVPPEVLPAALQGAQPRLAVDRPNVEVEQMSEQNRRGALPPPR